MQLQKKYRDEPTFAAIRGETLKYLQNSNAKRRSVSEVRRQAQRQREDERDDDDERNLIYTSMSTMKLQGTNVSKEPPCVHRQNK